MLRTIEPLQIRVNRDEERRLDTKWVRKYIFHFDVEETIENVHIVYLKSKKVAHIVEHLTIENICIYEKNILQPQKKVPRHLSWRTLDCSGTQYRLG